jgi:hypothetical protein
VKYIIIAILSFFSYNLPAQFGWGYTIHHELYHRYTNPDDGSGLNPSAGSFFLNVGAGPKIWIGGKDVSFSAEATANIGMLGLALKDYKGLGTASVPLLAKLNFKGLSTMDRDGRLGLSIGGGIQYSRTEIYGLTASAINNGASREWFQTYIVQAGYGFGLVGFGLHAYVRYGFNPDILEASHWSIGFQYDFNRRMMKKISVPESSL